MLALRSILAVFLLASVPLAQGKVWVVDDNGGAGVDFTDVQPAVDAAANGDVILVAPGLYTGFQIVSKSLTIQAEPGASTWVQRGSLPDLLAIRDTSGSQTVTIRGLRLSDAAGGGIVLENCAGTVWIEDCVCLQLPTFYAYTEGLRAEDCDSVVLVRSRFRGQGGRDVTGGVMWGALDGRDGLSALRSNIHAYGCIFEGGDGGWGSSMPRAGWNGGHGLTMRTGFLFLSDCYVEGGVGKYGPSAWDSGQGGHGVNLSYAAWARVLDSTAVGGVSEYPTMPDGLPFHVSGTSELVMIPGESLSCTITSPVREQETLRIDVEGPPNAIVGLVIGTVPWSQYFDIASGSLLVSPPWMILDLGVLGTTGTSRTTLLIPDVVGDCTFLFCQAGYFDPVLGLILGEGSTILLLDSRF
jgi:hypothetical protein